MSEGIFRYAAGATFIWCTDFTYIWLANGKMRYNCSIIDLYDRSVVATANLDYINAELAKTILEKALSVENAALFIEKNMEFVRPLML